MHVCREIQLSNVIRLSRLDPDALPNTATGRVEYVRLAQCLFANRNHIVTAISRVVYEDKPRSCSNMLVTEVYAQKSGHYVQLIRLARGQIFGHINCEGIITSTVEGNPLAIDKDRSLVVYRSKVE